MVLVLAWFSLIAPFCLLRHYEGRTIAGLKYDFCADAYILPASAASSPEQPPVLTVEVWADIALDSAVAVAEATQVRSIVIDGERTRLLGAPLQPALRRYRWINPPQGITTPVPAAGDDSVEPVYASKRFAGRFHLNKRQTIYLPSPQGAQEYILAGIFEEYDNAQGSLVIERSVFSRRFKEDSAAYLAVNVKPGLDKKQVYKRWEATYPDITVLRQTAFHRLLIGGAQRLLQLAYLTLILGAAGVSVLTLNYLKRS